MIVTTTTQVTDLVDQLVGDKCSIRPMMGPGVDPHLYKPTARDIMSLSTADLIVYHVTSYQITHDMVEWRYAYIRGARGQRQAWQAFVGISRLV